MQRMKVADYEKSKTTKEMDPEIEQCLSPVERKLARFLHRIEIRGKFGRKVAILLTPTMLEDVERVIIPRELSTALRVHTCLHPCQVSDP